MNANEVNRTTRDDVQEPGRGSGLTLEPPSWSDVERLRRRRRRRTMVPIALLLLVSLVVVVVEIRRRDDHGVRGQRFLEQGYVALAQQHPMRAIAYLAAARAEGVESPAVNMMFAEAARSAPMFTLIGHTERINSIAFSADGARVVTASDDNTARIWNAYSGKELMAPLQHRAHVIAAVFSPDDSRVITTTNDSFAQVWNAATGRPTTEALEVARPVCPMTFSADGTQIITADLAARARVWDASTGQPTALQELRDPVFVGCETVLGHEARYVRHDAEAWVTLRSPVDTVIARLEHQGLIAETAFSPDGKRVVTASQDGTARIWDAATGRPVTAPLVHVGWVRDAAFSRDGTHVITRNGGSSTNYARVWNATTGAATTPPLEQPDTITTAAFSPDGTHVVTASTDGTARLWDAATGAPATAPLDHERDVSIAVFSPDGKLVATTAIRSKIARIWRASSEKLHDPSPVGVTADGDSCSARPLTPSDMGSLDEWRRFARCTPFALADDELVANPDPVRTCNPSDCREASYLDFR